MRMLQGGVCLKGGVGDDGLRDELIDRIISSI